MVLAMTAYAIVRQGFKGARFDEVDYKFVGEYESTIFTTINCLNAADNEAFETDEDHEFCVVQGPKISCLRVLLKTT
jgi:hypothetical protein